MQKTGVQPCSADVMGSCPRGVSWVRVSCSRTWGPPSCPGPTRPARSSFLFPASPGYTPSQGSTVRSSSLRPAPPQTRLSVTVSGSGASLCCLSWAQDGSLGAQSPGGLPASRTPAAGQGWGAASPLPVLGHPVFVSCRKPRTPPPSGSFRVWWLQEGVA